MANTAMGDLSPTKRARLSNHALVIGATGIVGSHIAARLADEGWRVTVAVNNRPLQCRCGRDGAAADERLSEVRLDLSSREACEKALGQLAPEIPISHLFYAAFRGAPRVDALMGDATKAAVNGPSQDERERDVNLPMLQNIVGALVDASKEISALVRVVCIHGTKWNGVHLGPRVLGDRYVTPFREDAPRVVDPAQFYYAQQDWLVAASKDASWTWTCLRPFTIIGAAVGSAMNLGTGLAVYAAVLRELGEPLRFPGTPGSWTALLEASDVQHVADMALWAAEAATAGNEAFNAVNGDVTRWCVLWPALARFLGMEWTGPSVDETGVPCASVATLLSSEHATAAWDVLVKRHALRQVALNEVLPAGFLDAVLRRNFDVVSSMSKARAAGFTGYMDTEVSYKELFVRLGREGIVPGLHWWEGC